MFEIVFATMTLALAGCVKGLIGLGLPPIAMGILVLAVDPVEAAATMIVPALLTNVFQAVRGPALGLLLTRFWPMFALTAATTLFFSGGLASHAKTAIIVLGGLLVVYGAYGLLGPVIIISARNQRWVGPLSGIITGLVTAFTGVSSMPSVAFLQSAGLPRDELVQAMGLSFLISSLALIGALGISGGFASGSPALILAASLAAVAGMRTGEVWRFKLDETQFRRIVLWGLILLGMILIWR